MCYDLNYLWTTSSAQWGAIAMEGAGGGDCTQGFCEGAGSLGPQS